MTDADRNTAANDFVRDNLSPKAEQRDYISEKYEELKGYLIGSCFQAGSYARYTAIDPVHDLDIIYPVQRTANYHDPAALMGQLRLHLVEQYKRSSSIIESITGQTHSVTIVFGDSPEGKFSIDVVPAIELTEQNEYGNPLYSVPEVIKLNHNKRQQRYIEAAENPIQWIKSDPRGYISAAQELNDLNNDFRHGTKLIKGWRHACKAAYGDDFRLKSFHLEQVIRLYFESNPSATTLEALLSCLTNLPQYLRHSQIPDRANPERHIDEYVDELSPSERRLILELQTRALRTANEVAACQTKSEVQAKLTSLITVVKPRNNTHQPRVVFPEQPWAY